MDTENIDRNELKVMALRERVASLTAEYEDKVADLRVELTIVSQERDNLRAEKDENVQATEEG